MSTREYKGKSIVKSVDDYVVIDIETTGFSSAYDEIIELAAVRISSGAVVGTFSSLVRPVAPIPAHITKLTGINDAMVSKFPLLPDTLKEFVAFVADDIVVGQNISFDINFIYDVMAKLNLGYFDNDHIDIMRIMRRLHPEMEHFTLKDIALHFNIVPDGAHRALSDCMTTFKAYEQIKVEMLTQPAKHEYGKDYSSDETNELYGKVCVFTGELNRMSRAEAKAIVTKIGGICRGDVSSKTDYLILGSHDYCVNMKGDKSSKWIKAEEFQLKGQDIRIIPEDVFYDLIESSEDDSESSEKAKPPDVPKPAKKQPDFVGKPMVIHIADKKKPKSKAKPKTNTQKVNQPKPTVSEAKPRSLGEALQKQGVSVGEIIGILVDKKEK